MRTGPTSLTTRKLIIDLEKLGKKEKVALWPRIAKELSRPSRIRRELNLNKIDSVVGKDEIALVPGKVLSLGDLTKKTTVAAFRFSDAAKQKITENGGKAISIQELMKDNPKGKKVRIVG